jgi:NitT/TauT family transport system substrate-binding protein
VDKVEWLCCAVGLVFACTTIVSAAEPVEVRIGIASAISDVPIFIAQKKGFFADEGISAKTTTFTSASDMVAPLGAGELDVAGGSPSAGLYNAVARDIKLRIVADKASSPPGYGVNAIMVRKAVIDSGRFQGLKDLKGLKLALAGRGVSSMTTLNDALTSVDVRYADVDVIDMSFPQILASFQNGGIDAGVPTEPFITLATRNGSAVKIKGDDEIYPGHQIAALMYSEKFAESSPKVAVSFMRGYLRGVRFYNDALKDGRLAGPTAEEVIAILTESTPIKDPAVFRAITPSGNNPDGRVNAASLKHDQDFYRELGLLIGDVKVDQVVDYSYVDAALKTLGPYKRMAGETR